MYCHEVRDWTIKGINKLYKKVLISGIPIRKLKTIQGTMDSVWVLVALTALISSVSAGGNTFIPGPMESLFDDTESDPRNPLSPSQCVFTWIDVLKGEFLKFQ